MTTEIGINLVEKPDGWDSLDAKPVAYDDIGEAERELGRSFPTFSGNEIYNLGLGGDKPSGPLANVHMMPKQSMFIVQFSDDTEYLVDQTGARSYIRNWVKIA